MDRYQLKNWSGYLSKRAVIYFIEKYITLSWKYLKAAVLWGNPVQYHKSQLWYIDYIILKADECQIILTPPLQFWNYENWSTKSRVSINFRTQCANCTRILFKVSNPLQSNWIHLHYFPGTTFETNKFREKWNSKKKEATQFSSRIVKHSLNNMLLLVLQLPLKSAITFEIFDKEAG